MATIKKFKIGKDCAGQRLDIFLTEKMVEFSRSQIQKLITRGNVLVNKNKPTKHRFLKENDQVVINLEQISNKKASPKLPKINIISVNNDYVIVDKPSGLIVHADQAHEIQHTLAGILIEKFPEIRAVGDDPDRPGIIHRLDKNVSGVMVVARNQKSFRYLKGQFVKRQTEKYYLALVHGVVKLEQDDINFPITRKKTGFMAALPMGSAGKTSQTIINVVKVFNKYTLLRVTLITGRTHQIKVHLNAYHHPIVGEKIYTNKSVKNDILQNTLSRPFLHSSQLSFIDLSEKKVAYSADLPPDLQNIIKQLR